MEFTAMDALAYRSLGADEYAQRRSEVIGLAKELPEDMYEHAEAIDAELGVIEAEDERRAKLAEVEQRNMSKVVAGAAKPVETVEVKEDKMERAASLGEHFVQFRKEHQSADNRYIATPYKMRAAGDPTLSTGVVATQFDKEVVRKPETPLTVLDLFPRKQISEPVYNWTVYKQKAGTAGTTAEGATKNKLTFEYEQKSATLKKLTGLIKMTEELFEDAPYVVDAINGDLVDELNASRQSTAVADLLATSGIATASVTTTSGKEAINILDGIIDAAADVEDATGIAPNAVIVTPAIWKTIRKAKNTLDEYMAGNPFAESRYSRLFEMQFAKSTDLTANHVLVGAFVNRAVELVSKADGVRVDSTNSNDTDFEKNLVSVRAEAREVVACKRPACFCDITVS